VLHVHQYLIERSLELRKNPKELVLVHCSAGIGRTGTYIAILLLIELINYQVETLKTAAKLSVFGAVRRLREQRYNMVSQNEQYCFIY
jgi:protein-tyrosine phosphatase